jgi:hypothetical protein
MECRLIARIDPEGARMDDYARLLRAIGKAFPGAHCHAADGLGVIYAGTHPASGPTPPEVSHASHV